MRGPRRTRRQMVGAAAAAGFVALLVSSCRHPELGELVRNPDEPRECQREWRRLPKQLGGGIVGPGGFSVSGPITDVPEFNDCQKLLVVNEREQLAFGPLAAIFASFTLDSLALLQDTTAASPTDSIRAVALILTLGTMEYKPLAMKPGFSCLYLWAGVRQQWNASIRWVDSSHTKCEEPVIVSSLPNIGLRVLRQSSADPDSAYPPVARWDWDPSTSQHYIGIACARAWCEIGPRDFTPTAPYLPQNGTGPHTQRIKGWYDEQNLAIIDDNGNFVPGDAVGIVFPSRLKLGMQDLTRAAAAAQTDARWVAAAYIAIDTESPYYFMMMNLRPVPAGSDLAAMNVLSFCLGTRAGCAVPDAPTTSEVEHLKAAKLPRLAPLSGCDEGMSETIWVRIRSAGTTDPATDMFRCVRRHSHEHLVVTIPATARWRWLLTDETVWRECTQGCCEVELLG